MTARRITVRALRGDVFRTVFMLRSLEELSIMENGGGARHWRIHDRWKHPHLASAAAFI